MNEVIRQEKKYLLTLPQGARLSGYLREIMHSDEHNGSGGYSIRSLYFDTLEDSDFYDKIDGVEKRKKIRLRCYDPTEDFAMLEIKQKEGPYQKKRSLRMERLDAQQMIRGDYTALKNYKDPFAWECYCLMKKMCYVPRAVVEYRRQAYVAKENRIRITFDSKIIATESCFDIFSPRLSQKPVMDPFYMVLEIKYNGFLLDYIKSAVSRADCPELSVSKYCLARGMIMQ